MLAVGYKTSLHSLEMFVIPSFGLGSAVLIIVKCAHLKSGGAAAVVGVICARLGRWARLGWHRLDLLAEAQAEIQGLLDPERFAEGVPVLRSCCR